MRRIIFGILMAMLMAVATTSCGIEVQYEQVPFEEIRGTCTLNPSKVTPNVIYSKAEFDKIYTNVSPQVDMASNIVIMVCAPKSAQGTQIKITEVLNKEASMYVKYTVNSVDGSQEAGCPHATVAVSRAYAGYDISFFEVSGK